MGLFDIWIKIVIIICGKFIVFDSENDSGIFGDMDFSILGILNLYGFNKVIMLNILFILYSIIMLY